MNLTSVILISGGVAFILSILTLLAIHNIKNPRFGAILSASPCIIVIGTVLILIASPSDKQIDEALFIIPFSIINDLLFFAFWKYDTLCLKCFCCPKLNIFSAILIGLPLSYAMWSIYTLLIYYSLRRMNISILFIRMISILMAVLTLTTGFIGIIFEVWRYNMDSNEETHYYHQQLSSSDINVNDEIIDDFSRYRNIGNQNHDIDDDKEEDDDYNPMEDSEGKEVEDRDDFDGDNRENQQNRNQRMEINYQYIIQPMNIRELTDNNIPIGVYLGRGIITFFVTVFVGALSVYGDGILAGYFCVFPSIYSMMVVFLYSKYRKQLIFDSLYANILMKTGNNIFVILSAVFYLDLNINSILSVIISWIICICCVTVPISYLYGWRDKKIQKPELTILRKYISFNL